MRIKVDIGNRKIRRPLRLLAAHHARQTLRRLRELPPRMSVTLSEIAAAPEGLSKRCVVEMRSGRSGPVVMTSIARNWQTAIKLALRQASERLTAICRAAPAAPAKPRRLLLIRRPLLR